MIRHIVLFRLADETTATKQERIAGMRERLEPLREATPGVRSLRVGADVVGGGDHWDAALVADFADRGALDAYQVLPAHRAAVDWMAAFVADRSIADIDLSTSDERV